MKVELAEHDTCIFTALTKCSPRISFWSHNMSAQSFILAFTVRITFLITLYSHVSFSLTEVDMVCFSEIQRPKLIKS